MARSDGTSELQVGILGSGGISRVHANGWNAYPGRARIAAFADVAVDRAEAQSKLYTDGAAKVYGSLDDLLADPEIDVVDICLPHHLHTDAVIASAEAGKAILCEKPLCTNLDDARKIKETIDRTGVVFMAAHNQLFQPALIEARRLLATGVLGTPYIYRSIETFQNRQFNPHAPSGAPAGGVLHGWRSDLKQSGGGELLDTGYHSTYRLLSIANGDRPVEVTGFLSRFLMSHLPTEDVGRFVGHAYSNQCRDRPRGRADADDECSVLQKGRQFVLLSQSCRAQARLLIVRERSRCRANGTSLEHRAHHREHNRVADRGEHVVEQFHLWLRDDMTEDAEATEVLLSPSAVEQWHLGYDLMLANSSTDKPDASVLARGADAVTAFHPAGIDGIHGWAK